MFAKRPPTDATSQPHIVPLQPRRQIVRNTHGLRGMLFDELESFLAGKTTPERVRSVTQIANAVIDSARLELEFARYVKTKGAQGKKMAVQPVKLARRVA